MTILKFNVLAALILSAGAPPAAAQARAAKPAKAGAAVLTALEAPAAPAAPQAEPVGAPQPLNPADARPLAVNLLNDRDGFDKTLTLLQQRSASLEERVRAADLEVKEWERREKELLRNVRLGAKLSGVDSSSVSDDALKEWGEIEWTSPFTSPEMTAFLSRIPDPGRRSYVKGQITSLGALSTQFSRLRDERDALKSDLTGTQAMIATFAEVRANGG